LSSNINVYSDIKTELFVTNEDNAFIEGQSGLKLIKGGNLFLFERAGLSAGRRLILDSQIKQTFNGDFSRNEFFRGYLKVFINKFSFEIGKDNVKLGPGEYGLLLSNNVEPFLGMWDLLFVRGWLKEQRSDVSNPDIFALRFVWTPVDYLEIGATKTEMFGGDGRPEYSISEYLELLSSSRDNLPGDRYDNDGYAGYDVSLYLPLNMWFPSIRNAKFYFQRAGTDILAVWQVEDSDDFYFPFGFRLAECAHQAGLLLRTKKDIFRIEYADTSDEFYSHHVYNTEGYTYKGLSLGYPYGRNVQSLFFKHRHYYDSSLYAEYKLGGYMIPYESGTKKMHRYYASLNVKKLIKKFSAGSFVKLDWTSNYDIDPSPVDFEIIGEDKFIYIIGLSGSWRF
jgi:hypothetical protein